MLVPVHIDTKLYLHCVQFIIMATYIDVNQCLIVVMFQFIHWSAVFTFLIWQAQMSGLNWRHQVGFLNDRNHAVLTGFPDRFFST
jgi:hypothetical protein